MRLSFSRAKRPHTIYVIDSYRKSNGRSSSKKIETLGSEEEIERKYGCADGLQWAKEYVARLNAEAKSAKEPVRAEFSASGRIEPGQSNLRYGGDLLLIPLYNSLGLPQQCAAISSQSRAKYPLNDILESLVVLRVLFPCSKRASHAINQKRIRHSSFSIEDVYLALSQLAGHIGDIQAAVWKASKKAVGRNTRVVYYDCTNYYFDIEDNDPDVASKNGGKTAKGLRKRGKSKEHRPDPIVQMGMFMDSDGIPLAFTIFPGNESEQLSLQPLEEMMAEQFGLTDFIISTDAGLASESNRRYNMTEGREYIAVQSIPSLPESDQNMATAPEGWRVAFRDKGRGPLDPGDPGREVFNLDELLKADDADSRLGGTSLYKEIIVDKKLRVDNPAWGAESEAQKTDRPKGKDGKPIPKTVTATRSERVIVTYSHDFALYLKHKREVRVDIAKDLVSRKCLNSRQSQQDIRKFVKALYVTNDGEVAEHVELCLNQELIDQEARLDGFYAYGTSLDDDAVDVLKVRAFHYEIEHLFRTTKTFLKARPVYLSREDRIRAHFLVCFLAMVLLKSLQKKIDMPEVSIDKLIQTLREFNFHYIKGAGYCPLFERTPLTDRLQEVAGMKLDTQIVPLKTMRKICKSLKVS